MSSDEDRLMDTYRQKGGYASPDEPVTQLPYVPAEPEPRQRIEGTWLVQVVDYHTCGAGDSHGHEPHCGMIPEIDLSSLPGWDDLVGPLERIKAEIEGKADHDLIGIARLRGLIAGESS